MERVLHIDFFSLFPDSLARTAERYVSLPTIGERGEERRGRLYSIVTATGVETKPEHNIFTKISSTASMAAIYTKLL